MEKTSYPDQVNAVLIKAREGLKADLNASAALLVGSFGKEAWLCDQDGRLLSDLEIVFLTEGAWRKQDKQKLVKALNKDLDFEVELKGFTRKAISQKRLSNYSFSNPGYLSLNFFDSFSDPKWILGDEDKWDLNLRAEEVPLWEAWRLYCNRQAEYLSKEKSEAPNQLDYAWMKVLEAIADAFLISKGKYEKNIDYRVGQYSTNLFEEGEELSELAKQTWPQINLALSMRKEHKLGSFEAWPQTERLSIMNAWNHYFSRKMAREEHMAWLNYDQFLTAYSKQRSLQKKYLDFNGSMAIVLTNLLKFMNARKQLTKPFRKSFFAKSWRHLVLMSVSSFVDEKATGSTDFKRTKELMTNFLQADYVKTLTEYELQENLIGYWKLIR